MTCRIEFESSIVDVGFVNENSVAVCYDSKIALSRTDTGFRQKTFDLPTPATGILGSSECIFVLHPKVGVQQIIPETCQNLKWLSLDTKTENVIHGWARHSETNNLLLCTHQIGTRTSPISLVDKRTGDAHEIVKTFYRTKVELAFIGENNFALCPQNGQLKVFDLRFANKQLWSTSAEGATKIGVTAGKLHTIQNKSGIAVFDVTTGEVLHRKLLPPKGHANGFITGTHSDDLYVVHSSSQNINTLISQVNTVGEELPKPLHLFQPHKVVPTSFSLFKNELFAMGDTTGKVSLMIADTSVKNFGDYFVTIRDRNKARVAAENNDKPLKRMVKDRQRHHEMQEENEHAKTEMIAPGKSVRLSDFIKKGLIGNGSYGKVYLYESKRSGRNYAIKVVPNSSCVKSAQFEIERELKIHSTLHHGNVVKLFTTFKTAAHFYMVLEKMECTLRDVLDRNGKIVEEKSVLVMIGVFGGLQYCHQQEVVHRDVKPENVLMNGYETVKLADFGVSTRLKPKTFCGTMGYIAPEMFTGQSYSSSVDMFATGIMCHEMTIGDIEQFCTPDDKSVRSPYQPPKTMSKDLGDLIRSLTSTSVKKRPTALEALHSRWIVDTDTKRRARLAAIEVDEM